MIDAAGFLLFLFAPPLAAAFLLQLFLNHSARHRVRRWTAGLWVAAVAAISTFDEKGHWLGVALYLAMLLGLFFLIAWVGALLGSRAALGVRRQLRIRSGSTRRAGR
jgi:hypothetical protein